MLARIWRARANHDNARAFAALGNEKLRQVLRKFPGYKGGELLLREDRDGTDIVVITHWASMEDVTRFGDGDPERVNTTLEMENLLQWWDAAATIYDVAIIRYDND